MNGKQTLNIFLHFHAQQLNSRREYVLKPEMVFLSIKPQEEMNCQKFQ